MDNEIKVRVQEDYLRDRLTVYIWNRTQEGTHLQTVGEAGQIVWRTFKDNGIIPEGVFTYQLDRYAARKLADALDESLAVGRRETPEVARLEGELAASSAHLEDMRMLAFDRLLPMLEKNR